MKLPGSSFLFAAVLCLFAAGVMMSLGRPGGGSRAPAGAGAGSGASSGGGESGASGGSAGGQEGQPGAASGKEGKAGEKPGKDGKPEKAGSPAEAKPAAQKGPDNFIGKLVKRFRVLFGQDGRNLGFFQRLAAFFGPDSGLPGAAGAEAGAGAAGAPQEQKPQDPKDAKGPQGPDTSAADEAQRQIAENLRQTLEQQKMMRDLQDLQRQNQENLRMTLETQRQTRQLAENSKALRESSQKR